MLCAESQSACFCMVWLISVFSMSSFKYKSLTSYLKFNSYIPSKESSAQVDILVNSVLTRNGCITCYTSLFKEIVLQHLDAF